MPAYFLDSSALVKRWIEERGSARVRQLTALDTDHHVYVARLAIPEIVGAVTRRHRTAGLAADARQAVLALIQREIDERARVIEIGMNIWASATRLAARHAMRGADAIHVAAATEVQAAHDRSDQDSVVFVSADAEQAAAARAEGLPVEDPTAGLP